jgi:rare lipoprotein A
LPSNGVLLASLCAVALWFSVSAAAMQPGASAVQHEEVVAKPRLDRSGKARLGKASYYSPKFNRKKMANGKPLNPRKKVAASKTLPLGTVAKVTNLETGKSDVVTIEDRGPYVKGRIVDVSPSAAETIGLKKEGVAPVEVKPLSVPQGDTGDQAKRAAKPDNPRRRD